jgi:hypothetical protein
MTRMTALVLSVLLVTLLGGGGWIYWRLHLNASGYCENTKTYNDKDTIIRLAVENELKHMNAFGISLEGMTLEQLKAKGPPFRDISTPAYANVDEFFQHNRLPEYCLLDPDDERGPVDIGFFDRLAGYSHGLILVWASPYLEEDGTKIFTYRGDVPSAVLRYAYSQQVMRDTRFSVLKVTNCGETEVAWMSLGDWGGRH